MYSFTSDIETAAEQQDSLSKLKRYVETFRDHDDVSVAAIEFTSNFLDTSFADKLHSI